MSLVFGDDFGFSVESDFVKSNLICDVLLSHPDLSSVLHESSIDSSGYDQGQSPSIESLEFCVPDDGESMNECGHQTAASSASSGALDLGEHGDSPVHCGPGPIAAPLQNFPSVDVGYLRRRCKAESSGRSPAPSGGVAAVASAGRRRAESDPVPMRQSMRGDTRKRRMDEHGRRATTVELSEEERLEKNRQSARDCRLRKKRYIENLERRISEYEKREIVLTSTIARLEEQLASALSTSKLGFMRL